MDYANLFGGSDNFFKYMTIGGLLLIIIGLMYPLQKKQRLDLEIAAIKKGVDIYDYELYSIKKDISQLRIETSIYHAKIDSLRNVGGIKNGAKADNLVKEYQIKKKEVDKRYNDVNIKRIILDYEIKKLEILRSHLKTYSNYSLLFLIIGSVLILTCAIPWMKSSMLDNDLKKNKLAKSQLTPTDPPTIS